MNESPHPPESPPAAEAVPPPLDPPVVEALDAFVARRKQEIQRGS